MTAPEPSTAAELHQTVTALRAEVSRLRTEMWIAAGALSDALNLPEGEAHGDPQR